MFSTSINSLSFPERFKTSLLPMQQCRFMPVAIFDQESFRQFFVNAGDMNSLVTDFKIMNNYLSRYTGHNLNLNKLRVRNILGNEFLFMFNWIQGGEDSIVRYKLELWDSIDELYLGGFVFEKETSREEKEKIMQDVQFVMDQFSMGAVECDRCKEKTNTIDARLHKLGARPLCNSCYKIEKKELNKKLKQGELLNKQDA